MKVLLVVEDDQDMREVIRVTLESDPRLQIAGEAETAEQAIELARSYEPKVIILDHNIRGSIMGLEAAPLLKQVAPEAKILLFTAFDLRAAADEEPAIDAFLRKDHLEQLLPTVDRLLDMEPLSA